VHVFRLCVLESLYKIHDGNTAAYYEYCLLATEVVVVDFLSTQAAAECHLQLRCMYHSSIDAVKWCLGWCGPGISWGVEFQLEWLHQCHDFQPHLWFQSCMVQKVSPHLC